MVDGAEHRVECLGRRAARSLSESRGVESIRDFSAWFEPDSGLALTARRAPGADGHDADVVDAVLFEPGGPVSVVDPRFSTTYTSTQDPARVSLELWLGQAEGDEEAFPRRAAGLALGPGACGTVGELEVKALPFKCMSGGVEGSAVYLLVRRR